MLFPSYQNPMLRSFRSMLPRLLVLAGAVALAGCDSNESPLAPANEPAPSDAAAPAEAVAPADGLAALTTPRIAFTSYAGMLGDIYLMDAQGNNRTPFTTWASTEFAPSWSYDHKRIAMVRFRTDATNAQHYDIYLMNADGTNKRWAKSYTSAFHIMDPSWSPDGSRLVVTVVLQNLPYVATLNLATGQLALVSSLGGTYVQGEDPSYDPTGQKIVYVGSSHQTVDLVVPGGPHTIPVAPNARVGDPTFSPDGKKIAYSQIATGTFNNYEVFVKTLATGVVTRLTNNGKIDGEPSWSPDGTRIAFSSDRSGRPQIWTMNSSTGGVSSASRIARGTTWSRPGTTRRRKGMRLRRCHPEHGEGSSGPGSRPPRRHEQPQGPFASSCPAALALISVSQRRTAPGVSERRRRAHSKGGRMKPQLSRNGTILNAAVLQAGDLAHKRVLCPACMEKEFAMWPEGWDAHAAHKCKGLNEGSPESRKAEFKRVLGQLFR